MGTKLDTEKQAILDGWALSMAVGALPKSGVKLEEAEAAKAAKEEANALLAAEGKAPWPSATEEMMTALGPLLTETILDAAVSAAVVAASAELPDVKTP